MSEIVVLFEDAGHESLARQILHEIGTVAPFVEEAAERASTDLTKLLRWVAKTAVPVLSKVLSWDKYSKIREGLGSEPA
jgi:hypothetical protein